MPHIAARYKGKSRIFLIPALVILFLLVFTDKFAGLISTLIVKPLLSSVTHSKTHIEIISICAGISIIGYYIWKGWRMVNLSILFEVYIWLLTFIYLFFRLARPERFNFVPTKFLTFVTLTDSLLLLPLALLCYYISYCICYSIKSKPVPPVTHGFFTDCPLLLDQLNDSLGRLEYIKDIAQKILSTHSTDHSFAIGIIGPWGSGKTSFLNTLQSQFKSNDNIIQFHFNPWISHKTDNVTAIFFSDLAASLAKFDESLKTEIVDYSNELLQVVENKYISFITKFFNITTKEKELHEQYKSINQHIQRLDKKVVVYIDDVDRLDKKEVIEILRIIRNTADFGNTFFVVAFDKPYITTSINEALNNHSENYLEKIFQVEYYLPVYPDKLIYQKSLFAELRKHIPVIYQQILDYISSPSTIPGTVGLITHFEVSPPVQNHIKSFRDVKRFLNIFFLNYERIKHNIYLPDYISISLLRLKYPEVYHLLYYNKSLFLSTSQDYSFMESESGTLFLKLREKEKRNLENTELYYYLDQHYARLAINKNAIIDVLKLINAIFNLANTQQHFPVTRTLTNNLLTITDAAYFDRYFDFSMINRLDQNEFDTSLELPINELEQKIQDWSTSRRVSTDLIAKLENFPVPTNKIIFEKIVRAIVYLTNLPNPNNPNNLLSFNISSFYNKLGGKDNENNLVIQHHYAGKKEELINFFRSLFFLYVDRQKWSFIHDFAFTLQKEYEDDFILSHEELKGLIKDSFFASIAASQFPSEDIMTFYNQAIRLFQKNDPTKKEIEPIGAGIEMTEKFKAFLEKDISVLLSYNIFRKGPGSIYTEGGWHRIIYGSDEAFATVLERFSNNPAVKEYQRFQNEYRVSKQPIEYYFQVLNIQ